MSLWLPLDVIVKTASLLYPIFERTDEIFCCRNDKEMLLVKSGIKITDDIVNCDGNRREMNNKSMNN